jgi:putative FmdB family regulatory protein
VPIYEYTCNACNEKFDKLIKSMSSSEKIKCPKCGSGKTERALSVFAVKGENPVSSRSAKAHNPGCACCSSARSCPSFQG